MKPKVSIIVPCYNVEKYLYRCMDTLVNQSLKDIEIIIVDDGSPDRVPEMCDSWAKRDNRIKVVHKKNAGLGYARNSGIEVATGEFVAFVDSDDFVALSMYEKLYLEAVKLNADLICCCHNTERSDGSWKAVNYVYERTIFETKDEIHNYMLDLIATAPNVEQERKYGMSVWRCLYRRKLIEDNALRFRSEREVGSEDLPFQCEYLKHARKVIFLPQSYYYYCLNEGSLTATFKAEKYNRFKVLRDVLIEITDHDYYAEQRINRLFIGYTRSYLLSMFEHAVEDRNHLIKNIVQDRIWDNIKEKYPLSSFSLKKYIIIKLILLKQTKLLMLVLKCQFIIKEYYDYSR